MHMVQVVSPADPVFFRGLIVTDEEGIGIVTLDSDWWCGSSRRQVWCISCIVGAWCALESLQEQEVTPDETASAS